MPLRSHEQRFTIYNSVFGKARFGRHYFIVPRQSRCSPLDAALSLPVHCYSVLLSEWGAYGMTDASSRRSQTVIEGILGVA
jgi:hypothetical protein